MVDKKWLYELVGVIDVYLYVDICIGVFFVEIWFFIFYFLLRRVSLFV